MSAGLCIIPAAILGVWLFFLPRTPVFLVQKVIIYKSCAFIKRQVDILLQLDYENTNLKNQKQEIGVTATCKYSRLKNVNNVYLTFAQK